MQQKQRDERGNQLSQATELAPAASARLITASQSGGAVAGAADATVGALAAEAAGAAETAATEAASGAVAEADTQGVQEGMGDPGTAAAAKSKK